MIELTKTEKEGFTGILNINTTKFYCTKKALVELEQKLKEFNN